MIGWLLDTNVVGTIINPNGAPTVKEWAATQNEGRFFLSVLTLGEYDKGIHNLPDDHPNRLRFIAARDRLADCRSPHSISSRQLLRSFLRTCEGIPNRCHSGAWAQPANPEPMHTGLRHAGGRRCS